LVPVEQIAYVEAFEPSANGQFKPDKPFKGRVVLLNRAPQEFAEAHAFRLLPEDNVAITPSSRFGLRVSCPTEDFNPAKPYQTRLTVARSGRQQPQHAAAHQARNADHRDRGGYRRGGW
jgi:hypothetical protein